MTITCDGDANREMERRGGKSSWRLTALYCETICQALVVAQPVRTQGISKMSISSPTQVLWTSVSHSGQNLGKSGFDTESKVRKVRSTRRILVAVGSGRTLGNDRISKVNVNMGSEQGDLSL